MPIKFVNSRHQNVDLLHARSLLARNDNTNW